MFDINNSCCIKKLLYFCNLNSQNMKIKLFFVLACCVSAVFLSSCGMDCECKEWLNGSENNPYNVSLEGNGTVCSDYSTIIASDSLWTGIECYDIK